MPLRIVKVVVDDRTLIVGIKETEDAKILGADILATVQEKLRKEGLGARRAMFWDNDQAVVPGTYYPATTDSSVFVGSERADDADMGGARKRIGSRSKSRSRSRTKSKQARSGRRSRSRSRGRH